LKKKVVIIAIILIAALVSIFAWYMHSRKISMTIEAVHYQLGSANEQRATPVSITVNGYLNRNLNGTKEFKGTIQFSDGSTPKSDTNMHITFNKAGEGLMIYDNIENGSPRIYTYGYIFTDDQFSKVAIMKYTPYNNGTNSRGWNGSDGEMIAGPAKTREQALKISNELMGEYFRGYILE